MNSQQLRRFNRAILVAVLLFVGSSVIATVLLCATGCSGRHHSSDATQSPEQLAGVDVDAWGPWLCKDSCGCLPDRAFDVKRWSDADAADLCGGPWDCRYRCSASCASEGAGEAAAAEDPDPTVNVACLPFDGTGPVKYYRDRTIAHRARACIIEGACYYGCR